jgi:hypothetical protein
MRLPTAQHDEPDDAKDTMVFSQAFIVTFVPSWASCVRSSRRRVQHACSGTRAS